ncbi:MAG: 2OG-Fe(II) oxygenase [Hyphomonadaceae bacterium]
MPRFVNLLPGEPAPRFMQRATGNPRYQFEAAAGRNLVLCFMGSATFQAGRESLTAVLARRDLFDDVHASFFGVSIDPRDEAESRLASILPGYRFFWDFDHTISRLYGAWPADEGDAGLVGKWVVIDPRLRVTGIFPFREDRGDIAEMMAHVAALPPANRIAGMEVQAPIMIMDRVFDADLCQYLVAQYDAQDRELSGFMRDIDGKTHLVHDGSHKRRRDHMITGEEDIARLQSAIRKRIVPEIHRIHQFHVSRMERYLVACYAAEDEAHFRPHRDNTTKGTAHRRFAVSINLSEDFDGGEICFPEYGSRSYKPPPGAAVIFSCSMLHAVTQVTRGRRYAFLPFLYDEAAATLRDQNSGFLVSPDDAGQT